MNERILLRCSFNEIKLEKEQNNFWIEENMLQACVFVLGYFLCYLSFLSLNPFVLMYTQTGWPIYWVICDTDIHVLYIYDICTCNNQTGYLAYFWVIRVTDIHAQCTKALMSHMKWKFILGRNSSLVISKISLKDINNDVHNVRMLKKNPNSAKDTRDEEIFRELLPRKNTYFQAHLIFVTTGCVKLFSKPSVKCSNRNDYNAIG